DGFKVGIIWQGNPNHQWDHHRSIPLSRFAPLAEIEGVRLISLQHGLGREQLASLGGRFPVTVLQDLAGSAMTFADTAAIMKQLELVSTGDTASAHLAGALAVPVWVPLSTISDWRWLLGREDSPWYPSMRLFRQKELGRWPPVLSQMAIDLKGLVTQADQK